MVDKLSSKKYWNEIYKDKEECIFNLKLSDNYKKIFGILKRHIKVDNNKKVMEIGSAPGINLFHATKILKYKPYGLEYTENGYKLNQKFFKINNIDGKVIKGDFFDRNIIDKYSRKFDLVLSFGFIEHFTNLKEAIDNHFDLLKKNGLVVITIPNLKGINYLFNYFFNKKLFKIHNLEIMNINNFKKLFNRDDVEVLYCDYLGDFSFGLFSASNRFKGKIKTFLHLFGEKFFSRMFSLLGKGKYEPYLVFIGRKK